MSDAPQAVVIGTSAGAVEALLQLLPALPEDFPLPVIVVVHLPPDKPSVLAELFEPKCAMHVREVEDKELLAAGTIYFAPPNYHVLIEQNRTMSLSNEDPVLYSRPSIDVMFETAADAFGESLIGVLLTGANEDGARGLAIIEKAGGTVYVQQPEEAYCNTMPQAGLTRCTTATPLRLSELAETLQKVAHAQFAE